MIRKLFIFSLFFLPVSVQAVETDSLQQRYEALHRSLARGWNTWDVRSVLTHVYLPEAMAVDLQVSDSKGQRARTYLIGNRANDAPLLSPRSHAYDGSYSNLQLQWHGVDLRIENAAKGRNNVILITPAAASMRGATLTIRPKELWRRAVRIDVHDSIFVMKPWDNSFAVPAIVHGQLAQSQQRGAITVSLDQPVAICLGQPLTLAEARKAVSDKATAFETQSRQQWGEDYDVYHAMQSVLAWNTFYDPTIRRVITPVSRVWSSQWFASSEFGGFTLFCWDTYFASMMLGVDNKELAYANALEITHAAKDVGFVPNCYYSNGFKSRDRSQPQVGSFALLHLYHKWKDRWTLEYAYPELLAWNRWWDTNRSEACPGDSVRLLCPGSSPYEKVTYFHNEYDCNTRYGAILETGLDNSPMYDGVPFDAKTHLLCQQDVGLTSLYVLDCRSLAEIARILGHEADAEELAARGDRYAEALEHLWDEKTGQFLNRSTRDGQFNPRTSPTNFYPLLACVATKKQARRMVKEHLLNPKEYWGIWVLPSCRRSDPAYKDNDYWRGRIWAPLNFLVYAGVEQYDFPDVSRQLREKSQALLLGPWLKQGYIFENYNADSGEGDDTVRSDKFYHWGALLGYISLWGK